MGLFGPGPGAGSDPRSRAPRLEMLLGILGFFTLMAFIQTVVKEVRGQDALLEAVLLLTLVLATYAVWRRRRALDHLDGRGD